MAETSTMDKVMDRFRVKVIKVGDDDRTSVCGEKFISPRMQEHDGTSIKINGEDVKRPYCVIPAHQGDYIKKIFPSYQVSDPFIPGVDLELTFSPPAPDVPGEDEAGKK